MDTFQGADGSNQTRLNLVQRESFSVRTLGAYLTSLQATLRCWAGRVLLRTMGKRRIGVLQKSHLVVLVRHDMLAIGHEAWQSHLNKRAIWRSSARRACELCTMDIMDIMSITMGNAIDRLTGISAHAL